MLSLKTIDRTSIGDMREALKGYLFTYHPFSDDEVDAMTDERVKYVTISALTILDKEEFRQTQ